MLKESIFYKEDLPVNCSVLNIEEYPIHFHNDLEVVFVLKGNVRLKNGYYNYDMKAGDIYILNDREIHSYYGTGEPNAVLILQLNLSYFSRYYETLKNSFFITDMNGAEDESIEELQELIARISFENLSRERGYEKRIIGLAHSLIGCLISNFQYFAMEDGKFVNEAKNKGNKVLAGRLNRITDYMYENYSRRLTLTEIAEMEHLSIYYLSHFIKEATGLSFQDLLSFIRVEESEKLLLGTDKKIGAISIESGFSAVRYYIKYFTKWFGMHPADYREKYTEHVKSRDTVGKFFILPEDEIKDLLRQHIEDIFDVVRKDRAQVVAVEFDTEEALWKESSLFYMFMALMESDYMKPMAELLDFVGLRGEDIVAGAPGYIILRSRKDGNRGAHSSYSILFYNFSDKLIKTAPGFLTQSLIKQEIGSYAKQTEFFIKLTGLSGQYRIARCQFRKEAILARYGREISVKSHVDSREKLVHSWLEAPIFSVDTELASQVLNIQAQLPGSSMELVLIDLV